MGFFDRLKLAVGAMTGQVVAHSNYRYGTKSGHLFDGSKFKGSALYPSGWTLDHEALRDKSRVAYWDSTQARAIIGRTVDNVVGTGLAMECNPIWSIIGDQGMDEDGKHQWARDVETRFDLWASSHEADATARMNLYEFQIFEFLNRLRDGETFLVLRYSGDPRRMSPVSIQMILPEQVQTPTDKLFIDAMKSTGYRIVDGIEIDPYGKEIAIHVFDNDNRTFSRIPYMSQDGSRRFVLHPMRSDMPGATRGAPLLAPIVHELQKITDYTVAEIEAAVINAVMAVWVKPSQEAAASRALAGIQRRGVTDNAGGQPDIGTTTNQTTFDKPGLIVQTLKAGEEIQSFDTKRPNVNFGEFVRQIERGLGASTGLPVSIMNMEATKSYSAIRAELILFWRRIEIERKSTASQLLNPIYETWFSEEVKAGRISAPGFSGTSPVIRAAWLKSAWNGDKLPSIDPLKEANADAERIAQGVTTRERVAMEYNGSDAMDNIRRLAVENEALAVANAPLNPVVQVQTADMEDEDLDGR